MTGDELTFNDNQKTLLGFAAITFFMFIILIGDDDSILCCCTTVLLLLAVPFAATSNANTSTYSPVEPNSLFSNNLNKDIKNAKKRKPAKPKDIPFEWEQLKEIYPEAELDEYLDYNNFEGGQWDMKGLREDLELMIKRTGKKPTEKISDEKSDFKSMTNVALRKILRQKGLLTNGTKSKLIARLEAAQKQKSGTKEENNKKQTEKKEFKITKTVKKSNTSKKDTTEDSTDKKIEDLKALKEMLTVGLINDNEFQQMKKEILEK